MKKRHDLVIAALLVAAFLFVGYGFLFTAPSKDSETRIVHIKKGQNFQQITGLLSKAGLLKSPTGFQLLGRATGAPRRIKAGEYELTTAMKPLELLSALTRGKVKDYALTFPEGFSMVEIAAVERYRGDRPGAELGPDRARRRSRDDE